jgi:hypothetical protein
MLYRSIVILSPTRLGQVSALVQGVGCEQGIPTSQSKFCNFAEDDDYISPLQLHQSLDKPFPRGSVTVQHISVLESHIDSKSKKW